MAREKTSRQNPQKDRQNSEIYWTWGNKQVKK